MAAIEEKKSTIKKKTFKAKPIFSNRSYAITHYTGAHTIINNVKKRVDSPLTDYHRWLVANATIPSLEKLKVKYNLSDEFIDSVLKPPPPPSKDSAKPASRYAIAGGRIIAKPVNPLITNPLLAANPLLATVSVAKPIIASIPPAAPKDITTLLKTFEDNKIPDLDEGKCTIDNIRKVISDYNVFDVKTYFSVVSSRLLEKFDKNSLLRSLGDNQRELNNFLYHILAKGEAFYKVVMDDSSIALYLIENRTYQNMYDIIQGLQ